jgi:hypothetical protein
MDSKRNHINIHLLVFTFRWNTLQIKRHLKCLEFKEKNDNNSFVYSKESETIVLNSNDSCNIYQEKMQIFLMNHPQKNDMAQKVLNDQLQYAFGKNQHINHV